MLSLNVEILCIGDELLSGLVLNTNSRWLSRRITEIGGNVKRSTVIGDEICDISSAIRESLAREIDWLVISGGLGPTHDDLTLEGISTALGVELKLDDKAIEMLKKSYERLSLDYQLNEIRLKMARVPFGSIPIQNPVGIAPSVLIETASRNSSRIKIACLPGVPNEMKPVFSTSIVPLLRNLVGAKFHIIKAAFEIVGVGESTLNPVLIKIISSSPPSSIYMKTHPKGYTSDNKPRIKIQIVSKGEDKNNVEMRYRDIVNSLTEEVTKLKGKLSLRI